MQKSSFQSKLLKFCFSNRKMQMFELFIVYTLKPINLYCGSINRKDNLHFLNFIVYYLLFVFVFLFIWCHTVLKPNLIFLGECRPFFFDSYQGVNLCVILDSGNSERGHTIINMTWLTLCIFEERVLITERIITSLLTALLTCRGWGEVLKCQKKMFKTW